MVIKVILTETYRYILIIKYMNSFETQTENLYI